VHKVVKMCKNLTNFRYCLFYSVNYPLTALINVKEADSDMG